MASKDPAEPFQALADPRHEGGGWQAWLRVMEPRGWLAGVLLGGLLCPWLLLVVLPHQELATAPRRPEAEAGWPQALPTEAYLALERGKQLLGRGKAEAGLVELSKVLAMAPTCQEARWLVATTHERLGDRNRAARAYRDFLAVERGHSPWREQRRNEAEARLAQLEALP